MELAQTLASAITAAFAGGRRRAGPAAMLERLEVLSLDPRRRLHVVRCGSRQLLLVTGGPQDLALWLPPDQEVDQRADQSAHQSAHQSDSIA